MNMEKKRCSGLFGLVFGHKFEPVFDVEEKFPSASIKLTGGGDLADCKEFKKTLRGAMCRRCGIIQTGFLSS